MPASKHAAVSRRRVARKAVVGRSPKASSGGAAPAGTKRRASGRVKSLHGVSQARDHHAGTRAAKAAALKKLSAQAKPSLALNDHRNVDDSDVRCFGAVPAAVHANVHVNAPRREKHPAVGQAHAGRGARAAQAGPVAARRATPQQSEPRRAPTRRERADSDSGAEQARLDAASRDDDGDDDDDDGVDLYLPTDKLDLDPSSMENTIEAAKVRFWTTGDSGSGGRH